MRARLLSLLTLALLSVAAASPQSDNLRDLKSADLCPPVARAILNDEEDDGFSLMLENALNRYARGQHLAWGEQGSCLVTPNLVLDTYEEEGVGFVFVLELALDVEGEAVVQHGERKLSVEAPRVWASSFYGRYANDLQDIASRETRDMLERFAGDWRAAHRR